MMPRRIRETEAIMKKMASIKRFAAMTLLGMAMLATPALEAAAEAAKRVAIHVDENDPARMTMALNNAANIIKYYEDAGETVEIRLVAYGPGLHMFREDTSPVKDRIAAMALEHEGLSFAACGNTHRAMSAKAGSDVKLISEAEMIPSGVVELIELQEDGWAYIRP
jgi:intracellular sulfur oxidation DsrE/DsrF family protein